MQNNNELFMKIISKASKADPSKIKQLMSVLASAVDSEPETAVIEVFAALDPESRKEIIQYWDELYGKEYAVDMVKDYIPTGKKSEISKEALSSSKSDANKPVKEYWKNLRGDEFASDMVKYPNIESKKLEVEAMSDGLKKYMQTASPEIANELLELIESNSKKN